MKNRISYRSKLEGYNHSRLPEFTKEESDFIRGTVDFFSLQTYLAYTVSDLEEPDLNSAPSFEKDLATNASLIKRPEVGCL